MVWDEINHKLMKLSFQMVKKLLCLLKEDWLTSDVVLSSSFVMSASFTNQVLAQMEILIIPQL